MTKLEKNRKEFGQRVKNRRKELNMSMDELAQLMGYSHRSSIQKIESGENSIPQDKVEALAQCLKTTTQELMGWVQIDINNSSFAKLIGKTFYDGIKDYLPTEEELDFLNTLAMLNADGQELVFGFMKSLLDNPKYSEKSDTNSDGIQTS